MARHRRARPGRRPTDGEPDQPHPRPPGDDALAPSLGDEVRARDIGELSQAARTARRTGWPFGQELRAGMDTSAVPNQPPTPPAPRRFATSQPTAPFPPCDRSDPTNPLGSVRSSPSA